MNPGKERSKSVTQDTLSRTLTFKSPVYSLLEGLVILVPRPGPRVSGDTTPVVEVLEARLSIFLPGNSYKLRLELLHGTKISSVNPSTTVIRKG